MKIITAHIKKACAEKRIIMEKIKKNVSNIKIKDPGSAITHFIAMLMALFAATPLIIKALSAPDTCYFTFNIYRNNDFAVCCKYNLSYS